MGLEQSKPNRNRSVVSHQSQKEESYPLPSSLSFAWPAVPAAARAQESSIEVPSGLARARRLLRAIIKPFHTLLPIDLPIVYHS